MRGIRARILPLRDCRSLVLGRVPEENLRAAVGSNGARGQRFAVRREADRPPPACPSNVNRSSTLVTSQSLILPSLPSPARVRMVGSRASEASSTGLRIEVGIGSQPTVSQTCTFLFCATPSKIFSNTRMRPSEETLRHRGRNSILAGSRVRPRNGSQSRGRFDRERG